MWLKKQLWFMSLLTVWLAVTGCGVLRAPAEASGPIEAIPLDATATTAPEEPAAATDAPAAEPTAVEATAEPTTAAEPAEPASADPMVYAISQSDSLVRFELDEDLRGVRTTVVGETDQVAGQIALNLADLATAQVGIIRINARALATDNNFRNRAIQNDILETDSYEFITFTPTAVNGLPDSVDVGQSVTFSIDGDLTIRDITNPATFDITATAVSDTEIRGGASTVIDREAFDLIIPSVPNVANVEEMVELYIDFTALAVQ